MTQPDRKRPSAARDNRGGQKVLRTLAKKALLAGVPGSQGLVKRRRGVAEETIEGRLERKAVVADNQSLAAKSLGQMSREQRHKLLYGE